MKRFQNHAEAESFIESKRQELLDRQALTAARRERMRLLRPLILRLRRDGHAASAATLEIVARGGDTTRTAIVQLLNGLMERVGTLTKAELAASAAFRKLLDDATETIQ